MATPETGTDPHNPFAPPQAVVGDRLEGSALVLAGRGERFAAAFVDGMVVFGITLVTMALFGAMSHLTTPEPNVLDRYKWFAPAWALTAAIQAWCLYTSSQTVGKKLLKIRVVRQDGSHATFMRLFFGRGAFATVPGLVPVLGALFSFIDVVLIFRSSRQCLHDQVFDTLVVTAASSTHATLAAGRAGAPATA